MGDDPDPEGDKNKLSSQKRKHDPTDSDSESINDLKEEIVKLRNAFNNLLYNYRSHIAKCSRATKTGNDKKDAASSKDDIDEYQTSDDSTESSDADSDGESSNDEEKSKSGTQILSKYDWIVSKSKQKKNKQTKNSNNELATKTNDATKQNPKQAKAQVKPKPAPIYIRSKASQGLIDIIEGCIGKNSFHTVYLNKAVAETKVQVYDTKNYRSLTNKFDELEINYYSFQLKCDKGLCVVIRGIEPEVDTAEIKQALENEGFRVKNIHNIVNRHKNAMPLHSIEIDPESPKVAKNESHPIYALKYLLHRKIKVEEPRKRVGPVQCFNCQEFGHTKTYCHLPPVCVICGDAHHSSACDKDKKDPSVRKCKNCGENHTANFRGCVVFEHIKSQRCSVNQAPKVTRTPATVQPNLSFAQATKGYSPTNAQPASSNENILLLMTQLMHSVQDITKNMKNMQSQIDQIISKQ